MSQPVRSGQSANSSVGFPGYESNGWWTCSKCGSLVPNGCTHSCSGFPLPIQPQVTVVPGPKWEPLAAPQRARLILDFDENGEHVHEAAEGLAKIDGNWVLWWNEDNECWQSWPMHNVVCIDWLPSKDSTPISGDSGTSRTPTEPPVPDRETHPVSPNVTASASPPDARHDGHPLAPIIPAAGLVAVDAPPSTATDFSQTATSASAGPTVRPACESKRR